MKEIIGAGGPANLNDVASQRILRGRSAASAANNPTAAANRTRDTAAVSINGRAMSIMGELPAVRSELVTRLAKEVNDPSYDLDGQFSLALDKMLSEL